MLQPIASTYRANVDRSAGVAQDTRGDWFMVTGNEVPSPLYVSRDVQQQVGEARQWVVPGVVYRGRYERLWLYHAAQRYTVDNTFQLVTGRAGTEPLTVEPREPDAAAVFWRSYRSTAAMMASETVYSPPAGKRFRLLACELWVEAHTCGTAAAGAEYVLRLGSNGASFVDVDSAPLLVRPELRTFLPGAPLPANSYYGPNLTTGRLDFGRGLRQLGTSQDITLDLDTVPGGMLAQGGFGCWILGYLE